MSFDSRQSILAAGFEGGVRILDLQATRCALVPKVPGIYLVARHNEAPVHFLRASSGPHLGGIDPTVSLERLRENWLPDCAVLYIGKAGGSAHNTHLHGRIKAYVEYGQGLPRLHRGGRLIWQLADVLDCVVYWATHEMDDPRAREKTLIRELEERHGRMPFANLTH